MSSIVIKLNAAELPDVLRKEGLRIRGAVKTAAKAAALKLKTYLVRETDRRGITFQGIYKGGFRATENSVVNDAPHAGIVELGARPHKVSKAGREAIKRWAMIKLGLDEKDAESASWGIAKTIEMVGQEGYYVMRDAAPKAVEFYKQELTRNLQNNRGKKP
jgi:hypothetical protein